MVNQFLKIKPLRSKEFMAFAHKTVAPCCICMERSYDHLHHFGDDGGMAMKPSDYNVARLCMLCHQKYDMKERTLLKNGLHEQLMAMMKDALTLHDLWFRHIEENKGKKLMLRCLSCDHCKVGVCHAKLSHVEPPNECALDDLTEKLMEISSGDPIELREWFVQWSNIRSSNVIGFSMESFFQILSAVESGEMKFIASQALKVAGVKGIE